MAHRVQLWQLTRQPLPNVYSHAHPPGDVNLGDSIVSTATRLAYGVCLRRYDSNVVTRSFKLCAITPRPDLARMEMGQQTIRDPVDRNPSNFF